MASCFHVPRARTRFIPRGERAAIPVLHGWFCTPYCTSYPSDLIFLERLCSLRYLVSLDILIRFGGAARILPTLCSSPLRHIANAGVYFTKYLPPGPAPGISRRTALPTRWARVQGALTVVPVIIPSLSCQGRRNRLSRYAADILLLQYSNMAMAR